MYIEAVHATPTLIQHGDTSAATSARLGPPLLSDSVWKLLQADSASAGSLGHGEPHKGGAHEGVLCGTALACHPELINF